MATIEPMAEHVCRGMRVSGDAVSVWNALRTWWAALDTAGPAAKTAAVDHVSAAVNVPRETLYDWRRRFRRCLLEFLSSLPLDHRQQLFRHLLGTTPQALRHQSLELLVLLAHATARQTPPADLHLCGRTLVSAAAVAMEGWITGYEFATSALRTTYDLLKMPRRMWEARIPLAAQLAQAGLDCLRALTVRDIEWEAYAHASSAHAYDQAAMSRRTRWSCCAVKGLDTALRSGDEQSGLAPHLMAASGLLRKLDAVRKAGRPHSERVDRIQALESEHTRQPPPGYHLEFGPEHKRIADARLRVRLLMGEAEYCLALHLPDLALDKLHAVRGMIDEEYLAGLGRHCRLRITAQAQLGEPRLSDAIEEAEAHLKYHPYQRSLVRALVARRQQ